MLRQSSQYAEYLKLNGWKVELINKNYIYIKKVLFWNFIKIQRIKNIKQKDINYLINKYHPFSIIIEPLKPIKLNGFNICREPYLPTKTLQIDIGKSEKEILKSFKKDVQRAINKPIYLDILDKITTKQFNFLWRKAVPWGRYIMNNNELNNLQNTFGNNSLFVSNGLCGIIFLISNKTLFYYQAWSNKKHTNVRNMYHLVWKGIVWGKNKGCTKLDFDGIYDERFPIKSWVGFTNFKKRFGGKEVSYPPCLIWKRFSF